MRRGTLVKRKQLARLLRELRQRCGLTTDEAALKLDFSPSKLSRIENAHQSVDVHVVRSMMDVFGVHGDRWAGILELTRAASTKGWWRAYGLDDHGYVPLEAEASTVREYAVTHLPGLLQTPDYAQALLACSRHTASRVVQENDPAVRAVRQKRLRDAEQPLEVVAVVEESALRRVVGGAEVMRAQLAHLHRTAALDTVTVQVLLSDVRGHPGVAGGFVVLSFAGLGEPDTGYVEHPMGTVEVDKAEDVTRGLSVFDQLRALALGPEQSTTFLRRLAERT